MTNSSNTEAATYAFRPVTSTEFSVLLEMVRELAEFEKLTHLLRVDKDRLAELLSGTRPVAGAGLAWAGHDPVGFVLYYENISSFYGARGLYIEDLYVRPAHRNQGVGRRLLEFAAAEARMRGCELMEWQALDWNRKAIDFYTRLGAAARPEWITFRLEGDGLDRLAERED